MENTLLIFHSLINGENYNVELNSLKDIISKKKFMALISTIECYFVFISGYNGRVSFNLYLTILLDMFDIFNQIVNVNYEGLINSTINFRNYLRYTDDRFILNVNFNVNRQVNAPVALEQIYSDELNEYVDSYEGPVNSDSDEEIVPVQSIQVNPNQIIILNNPDDIPSTEASLSGPCVVCQLHDTGQGWCRVDCGGGHVGHCSCFNIWRNTHTTTIDFETNDELENVGFHNECPICRGTITSMVHIPQPPNTSFGKRKKETLNLISLEKDIKYLNKLK